MSTMSCEDTNLCAINTSDNQIDQLRNTLVNKHEQLEKRFRCAFTLRAIGSDKAIEALADAFKDEPSALLKHEVAYCLGQTQNTHAVHYLSNVLADTEEHPMVRHEVSNLKELCEQIQAAEGLGAIGGHGIAEILKVYSEDPVREIAETCKIAIDRAEWIMMNKDMYRF